MQPNPLVRTLRCRIRRRPGNFGLLATSIGSAGALIGEIRTHRLGSVHTIRDIEVFVDNLRRWREGRPLHGLVDVAAGY